MGQRELPAGFVAGHHERLQIGAGGIDGRRVAGATGTYDHYVSHGQILRLARGPRRARLAVGRVFVPLQAGGINAGDVGAAVFVEVGDSAGGGAHTALIEVTARPVLRRGLVAVDIDAVRLPAEAGDDFVHAIAVEVGDLDSVAVQQAGIDDFAFPLCAVLGVDRDLVAVPGFDGGEKSCLSNLSHGNIAGAGFGPRCGIALGDFRSRPAVVPGELEEVDARED